MDPLILIGILVLLVILGIRIFFGVAKLVLKIGLIVLAALIIWRVFMTG